MEHELNIMSSIIIPYINFALFLAAFVYFFRKPLKSLAQGRRDQFLKASKEAEQTLEVAKKSHQDVQKRLNSLDQELSDFAKQSETQAQIEAKRIHDDTARFVAQLNIETKRIADEAVDTAKQELRREIIAAAVKNVEHKISSEMNVSQRKVIVGNKISEASKLSIQ